MAREVSEYVERRAFDADGTDAHGNDGESWGEPEPVGIWAFDPGSSSEPRLAGQDRVIVQPTIYFPAGTIFGEHDLVKVRGLDYEVEGETREWRHPNSAFAGNVVTLRRVEG